ncbi:MAG TPA: hypothetical protein VK463_20325 [Desulfomonilaceae bacterium]|nr:hypothetical protein [Desulfomonilaceae bacterium]
MTEEKPKWTVERVHEEISVARTKLFVVAKYLETGNLKLSESPEWALVIRPLLKDLITNANKIQGFLGD